MTRRYVVRISSLQTEDEEYNALCWFDDAGYLEASNNPLLGIKLFRDFPKVRKSWSLGLFHDIPKVRKSWSFGLPLEVSMVLDSEEVMKCIGVLVSVEEADRQTLLFFRTQINISVRAVRSKAWMVDIKGTATVCIVGVDEASIRNVSESVIAGIRGKNCIPMDDNLKNVVQNEKPGSYERSYTALSKDTLIGCELGKVLSVTEIDELWQEFRSAGKAVRDAKRFQSTEAWWKFCL